MKTIIVWFRNDLRVHDHPALSAAARDADHIVPVFIFDEALIKGEAASSNRNRFLLESLEDLKRSLRTKGADLVVRHGEPKEVLSSLLEETSAEAIYYTADYTPYAVRRDKALEEALPMHSFAGRLVVGSIQKLRTYNDKTFKVFTPFWKKWSTVTRRSLASTPQKLSLPSGVKIGTLPSVASITKAAEVSPHALPGGETEGRKRLMKFLDDSIVKYHQGNNDMAEDATSRLSAYLHFGCISPLEIETLLPDNAGARAWHRQLCWREFYHYVLLYFPHKEQEFQERYRTLSWDNDADLLNAWKQGKTGYPIVDAGMRQLLKEGWMHNRARLIVGSFLTKDLWIDWREGEAHFMRWLIDGDTANNNGNWQWIASVGVDPAPVFRRLYNPSRQQEKFDPTGDYVRRYVPELTDVPTKFLGEPWNMSEDEQREAGCVIGKDYPGPVVDHKEARQRALEQYRAVS